MNDSEQAPGRREEALRLLHALEALAKDGRVLPEQVWDAPDVPGLELIFMRPTDSAMPLVWAHAEHVKLRRSLQDACVCDMPAQPVQRYQVEGIFSRHAIWRFNHKLRAMPAGKTPHVEVTAPASVHWSGDGWQTTHDAETWDTGLGMHVSDLPTSGPAAGTSLAFAFDRPADGRW
jgi:glucoamylase